MTTPRVVKRRGQAVVAMVLQATLEEIALSGPDRLSLEAVASRAGVNKTSIWRRWPTPEALALDAVQSVSDTAGIPDTGSLRGDLTEYVRRFREVCRVPAMLSIIRLRYRAEFDNSIGGIISGRFAGWEDEALVMFHRAIARRELAPDADAELLRDALHAIMNSFVLLRYEWFQGENIDAAVKLFLDGAARA